MLADIRQRRWLFVLLTMVLLLGLTGVLYLTSFSQKGAQHPSAPRNEHTNSTELGENNDGNVAGLHGTHSRRHAHPHPHVQASEDDLGDLRDIADAVIRPDIDEGIEKHGDYFRIHEDTIGTMLSEIRIKNREIVSTSHLSSLRSVLETNILAYKHGSAEEILADRLRVPYSILPEATRAHINILKRHYLRAGESLPSDPEAIMRLLVDRRYGGTNGSGFADLYKEMSVQGSEFAFQKCKAMPTPITTQLWTLSDAGARTFKNGVITHHPSIEYLNSPSRVLEKYGQFIYVDVRIAASDSQDLKYSRLKRFYWSPDDGTWLPMEVVSLYARDRKGDEWF